MTIPAEKGWHLKKEIQLGHLLTTFTVAISAIVYINTIEKRVAILEEVKHEQNARDERQDKQNSDALALIRAQLDKIDSKLDRLMFGQTIRKP